MAGPVTREEFEKLVECVRTINNTQTDGLKAIADAFEKFATTLDLLSQRTAHCEDTMIDHAKVISARSEVTDAEPN